MPVTLTGEIYGFAVSQEVKPQQQNLALVRLRGGTCVPRTRSLNRLAEQHDAYRSLSDHSIKSSAGSPRGVRLLDLV